MKIKAGQQTIAGIININKPKGLTSHDVVKRVRQLFGLQKVGHCGTLDPMATGVLVVCLGQATRLIEYLVPGTKQYCATIYFGRSTDTYDAEGEITAEADLTSLSDLNELKITQALGPYIGSIQQMPPPFSAIKKNGVPLYKFARQGKKVDLQTRTVHINTIELLSWHKPKATLRVICQAGTYIRSLAHELGQDLQVGAHLTALSREASGCWSLADAVSLEDLAQSVTDHTWRRFLHPLEAAITHLPSITLSPEQVQRIRLGQFISSPSLPKEETIVGYDPLGKLVALLVVHDEHILKPKKVFQPSP